MPSLGESLRQVREAGRRTGDSGPCSRGRWGHRGLAALILYRGHSRVNGLKSRHWKFEFPSLLLGTLFSSSLWSFSSAFICIVCGCKGDQEPRGAGILLSPLGTAGGAVQISLSVYRDALAAALETRCLPRYVIPIIPTSTIDFGC